MATQTYNEIFDHAPVGILKCDYSSLGDLALQLKKHTVTNVRQYLMEHPGVVKKMFKDVHITIANKAALQLFEVKTKQQLSSRFITTFTSGGMDILIEHVIALLEGDNEFSGEFKYKSKKRKYLDISLRFTDLSRGNKKFDKVIITLQNITIWKKLERQLRKKAQLDGLTNLLNHTTITQRLDEELIRAKRYGLSMSCLMIDLDHFKVVNDKFGHQRGDQVLKRVASMIKNCVRKVDVVGRYGGDEFLIILPETKPEFARYAAQRILNVFSAKSFKYQRIISFQISLSIGITGYPSKKVKDAKDLISLADRAMYMAKKSGRNRIATI